ncbi:unnamed protein product [Pleuronectes platessa]|uniref:Uncharacterized protein n=1 Tax=Pleuronectes platessa TaxID=8262 RepID=A0A9N7VZ39_PLEPL|nr:unnamed protein product [Pleuronectes platessa]
MLPTWVGLNTLHAVMEKEPGRVSCTGGSRLWQDSMRDPSRVGWPGLLSSWKAHWVCDLTEEGCAFSNLERFTMESFDDSVTLQHRDCRVPIDGSDEESSLIERG